MAALMASVPLPLLLDSLLASSWTWLALSLATIATLLRALSGTPFGTRPRPQALLTPPSSRILSAETEKVIVSDLCRSPLQKGHKRRIACRSSPSLNTVGHRQEHGLRLPESGFPSSLGSRKSTSELLRKSSSTSEIRNGLFCGGSEHPEGSFESRQAVGSAFGLGFVVDSQEMVSVTPTECLEEECDEKHRPCVSAKSPTCKLTQKSLWKGLSSSLNMPPSFETQLGWCELLKTKLGFPWKPETAELSFKPAIHSGSVVKQWSVHERNLFAALKVEGDSVRALDTDIVGGFACIAQNNGDISQWDITNQACLSRVCCNGLMSALSGGPESRFSVAAGFNSVNLWDFRSPNLVPILKLSLNWYPYPVFQCEGNTVCIHQSNDFHQLCDIRKPQLGLLTKARTAPALMVPLEERQAKIALALWEKLSLSDDEELWDEPILGPLDQKSSSFTSRCATLLRSLSSSGR